MTASTLATLQRSRVTSTSVEGFDHIIGISQGTINEQLEEAWKYDERLQKFDVVSHDDNGNLHALADAPSVQIQLGSEQQDVIFYLNLASGTWQWWDGVGRKAKFITDEFTNWRLAFRVKPTLRPAQETDVIPEKIQASLANYGEHTVKLLVLGLTSLNEPEFVESLSSVPDTPDSEEKHEQKVQLLTAYMQSYIRRRTDSARPQVVLGYVPELTSPVEKHKSSAPVFPTSLAIQGYPYIANLAKTQDQVSDLYSGNTDAVNVANNNLLLITGMASNRPFPKDTLTSTASWAVPTEEGKLANPTVVLSRQSFLEGYLLPRLTDINKASVVKAISTECRMNGLLGYRAEFDIQYGSDKSKEVPTFYDWKYTSQSTPPNEASVVLNASLPSYGYTVASSPCLVWEWKTSNMEKDDDGYKSKLSCGTNNWLVIPKGTRSDKCSIYICGKATVEASTEVSFLDRGSMKITGTWATEIKLSTSPNGGIAVSVETGKLDVKSTHSGTPYEEPERGIKKRLTGVIEGLPTKVKPLANMPINRWQYFIPAIGDFSLKNPTFNYNGDLLLDLVQHREVQNQA